MKTIVEALIAPFVVGVLLFAIEKGFIPRPSAVFEGGAAAIAIGGAVFVLTARLLRVGRVPGQLAAIIAVGVMTGLVSLAWALIGVGVVEGLRLYVCGYWHAPTLEDPITRVALAVTVFPSVVGALSSSMAGALTGLTQGSSEYDSGTNITFGLFGCLGGLVITAASAVFFAMAVQRIAEGWPLAFSCVM